MNFNPKLLPGKIVHSLQKSGLEKNEWTYACDYLCAYIGFQKFQNLGFNEEIDRAESW